MQDQDKPAGLVRAVAGIDAAITARHHIAVREFFVDGTEHLSRFTVDPTLAGLERLTQRLAAVQAPLTAVVESTSMIWLALALAVERAGGQMEMIGTRHSARLRGAIMGKNKSDVIDSEVLTHAGEIFDPPPLVLASRDSWRCDGPWSAEPEPSDGNRYWRRVLSLARWALPEHLADLQESRARVERFTSHARQWWEQLCGDDPLILSLPAGCRPGKRSVRGTDRVVGPFSSLVPAEDHEDMAEYGVEARATEHRCQCCGEIADDVFCDDCKEHMSGEAESVDADVSLGEVPPARPV